MRTMKKPGHELVTSSNSQPSVPVLHHHQGPGASSQKPAANSGSGDEDSEDSDDCSAQSQDSGRTVLYSDLDVLSNNEHWAMTLGTHKYAAAAESFFINYRKWRSTGHMQQFENYAVRATILVPQ